MSSPNLKRHSPMRRLRDGYEAGEQIANHRAPYRRAGLDGLRSPRSRSHWRCSRTRTYQAHYATGSFYWPTIHSTSEHEPAGCGIFPISKRRWSSDSWPAYCSKRLPETFNEHPAGATTIAGGAAEIMNTHAILQKPVANARLFSRVPVQLSRAHVPLLQRKCNCGSSSTSHGECEECRRSCSAALQPSDQQPLHRLFMTCCVPPASHSTSHREPSTNRSSGMISLGFASIPTRKQHDPHDWSARTLTQLAIM